MQKIPYALIVGEQEVEAETINVRPREGEELGAMSVMDFMDQLPAFNVQGIMQQGKEAVV